MRKISLGFVIFVLACCQIGVVTAQEEKKKESRPAASINDIAWIAGHWQGEAMGGKFEETWNPPLAGEMVGMFKLTKGDKVNFYELLTIVPHNKSLVLRLKHFGEGLVGWEEKDKSVEFPLKEVTKNAVRFDGLTFEKINDDQMKVVVVVGQGDGKTEEITFNCKRAGAPKQELVASAIHKVLGIDEVIAKQRDYLCEKESLATSVRSYVLGLDKIDYSHCPPEFAAAYKKHRDAWHDSIAFLEKHPKLRGEMHQLFDQLRKMDKPVSGQLETHYKAIMDTWKDVESVAKKHGVG